MAMTSRRFALLFGLLFLLFGIAGFVPPLMWEMHPEYPPLIVSTGAGRLLGWFPVNLLHSGLHVFFGLWGGIASRRVKRAKLYARNVGIIYILLTIAGFVPGLQNGFGFLPLYGNDIWLHGVLGFIALYFGWVHRDIVDPMPASVHPA